VVIVWTAMGLKPRLSIQSMRWSGLPVKLWNVLAGPERDDAVIQATCRSRVS
jgi:hypothetical protein